MAAINCQHFIAWYIIDQKRARGACAHSTWPRVCTPFIERYHLGSPESSAAAPRTRPPNRTHKWPKTGRGFASPSSRLPTGCSWFPKEVMDPVYLVFLPPSSPSPGTFRSLTRSHFQCVSSSMAWKLFYDDRAKFSRPLCGLYVDSLVSFIDERFSIDDPIELLLNWFFCVKK